MTDTTNRAGSAGRLKAPGMLALLLTLLLGTLPGAGIPDALAQATLRVGSAPPRISLPDLAGRQLRIPDDLRGKVVILHFWAGGCSSCKEEMPAMESLHARYGRKGLEVLAVNVGQRKETVQKYVVGMKVSYPIFLDLEARAAREYQVVGVPKTFILDRSGQIRYKIVGGATLESLNKLVQSLM